MMTGVISRPHPHRGARYPICSAARCRSFASVPSSLDTSAVASCARRRNWRNAFRRTAGHPTIGERFRHNAHLARHWCRNTPADDRKSKQGDQRHLGGHDRRQGCQARGRPDADERPEFGNISSVNRKAANVTKFAGIKPEDPADASAAQAIWRRNPRSRRRSKSSPASGMACPPFCTEYK